MSRRTRRLTALIAASALLTTVGLATPAYAAPGAGAAVNDTVEKLTKAVKVSQVLNNLRDLQKIADRNGGDRAAGRPGYAASVDYIVDRLEKAGYDPVVQEFEFEYIEDNSSLSRANPPTTWELGQDFVASSFESGTPEGTATGALTPVGLVIPAADLPPSSNTSGCEPEDFAGFTPGSIALVQRGTCTFAVKALNAQAAGASAVIIMNEGQPGRSDVFGIGGTAPGLTIPVVAVSTAVGEDLASTPGAQVTVSVDVFSEPRTSFNVLAETGSGDDGNVVMAGAHLDSVQAGPGINDNGSGSAALLETALQMRRVEPTNTVRFAWWGAEEEGLLGSEYYVENLTQEQIDAIALYLNFDMIASPNYINGIYDGDGDSGLNPPGVTPPAGSGAIEQVFEDFFDSVDEPYQDVDFSGRSDYGPFIAVDIPAGGLFTGAEEIKTADEAALYGGIPGVAYDPCYHEACDNLTGEFQDEEVYDALRDAYRNRLTGNVNREALDVNSDAMAAAIITFAFDTSALEGPNALSAKTVNGAGGGAIDLHALRDLVTQ